MPREMLQERLCEHPKMPRVGDLVADRYEIVRIIGEGGFAVVYRARDAKLGGEVAIKVLDPEKSAKRSFVERFKQEITLTRQLHHHNTIKIYDAGTTESGCLYMAMEVVVGEGLDSLLARTGAISLERVVRITSQVLKSLAEAHKHEIIHRDLKPSNIMIAQLEGEEDYVKVVDFGIAKALSADLDSVQTQTGQINCTPNYAPPEILRGDKLVPASDLYALGLTMLEMLTGCRAVQGGSLAEIMAMQISRDPIHIPDDIKRTVIGSVIERSIAKSLDERYTSALEMLQELRGAARQAMIPSPAPSTPGMGIPQALAEAITADREATLPTRMSTRIVLKRFRRRFARYLAVAGAAVVAVAVLLFVVLGHDENDQVEITGNGAATAVGDDDEAANAPREQPEAGTADGSGIAEVEIVAVPLEVETIQIPEEGEVGDDTDQAEGNAAVGDTEIPEEAGEMVAEPTIYRTRVIIESDPTGATVRLAGETLGTTPFDRMLESSESVLRLSLQASGYHFTTIDVDMTQGEMELDVNLEPREVDETEHDVAREQPDDEELDEHEEDDEDEDEQDEDEQDEDEQDEDDNPFGSRRRY